MECRLYQRQNKKRCLNFFSTIGFPRRNGQKGNGGLSTVKISLANLGGGKITVKSKMTEGTVISFTVIKI
jgi:hypothetical protein